MSERKLASIRKISDIQPIEGADLIELAIVDGWKVVVGKEVGHKIGDFVIYCEVDSFLPIREEFEFLRKSSYRKMIDQEGFLLKTIKLRGCVSQGLIIPLSILEGDGEDEKLGYLQTPDGPIYQLGPYDGALVIEEGADVTNILGIVKWDPPMPACLSGIAKGNFPSWGRKTDQERAQNLVLEIEREVSNGSEFEITIKLDGTSMSVGKRGDDVVVCSRNLILDMGQDGNTLVDIAKSSGILDRIGEFGDIMISGELCGPGIQGNREKLKDHKFFVFDIFDVRSGKYMGFKKRMEIVKSLGLDHVPILHELVKLNDIGLNSLDDMLAYSNGKSLNSPIREGLVFKKTDGSFSFKVISNEFLLKFE
jgi:RNA ligase (TIGR02306 family)